MEYIIKTDRLKLRKIQKNDYENISNILQDIEVMYAWERSFSKIEIEEWIEKNINNYEIFGFSYWAVIEKKSNKLIGVCGLLNEKVDNDIYVGIGYIFNKNYWDKGFAFESAKACIEYGFNVVQLKQITAQIRPENAASIKLAKKLGMTEKRKFIKIYKEKQMEHILFELSKY